MGSIAENAANTSVNRHEMQEDDEHFSYAMQLVTSSAIPMVMTAAVRLDLFEIIARAGSGARLSAAQIAARLPRDACSNPNAAAMLDRMLRLLASYSVLKCSSSAVDGDGEKLYGLAPVADYFVRKESGLSLGPMLDLFQDKVVMDAWYELADAVVEGGVPFDRAHGTALYEYCGMDTRFNAVLNKAMINHSSIVINKILERYQGFERLNTLVDVGGGLGINLKAITTKWPHLRGINFDLPHVIQHAPAYPGVEHIAGNMFESVPKADAIFMKWILHNWDDDHCLKLLKNCDKSLPENGKVIVVDAVLPAIPDTSAAITASCQSDVFMMTSNPPGSKERTEKEFLDLAAKAGFRGMKLECLVCNLWVMEFHK